MATTIDFSGFTVAEKTDLLSAAKAELLRRVGLGSVQNGTSAGQNFGMMKVSTEELTKLINSLSASLGFDNCSTRIAPNFSGRGFSRCC